MIVFDDGFCIEGRRSALRRCELMLSTMAHLDVELEIEHLDTLNLDALRARWRSEFGRVASPHLSKSMLAHLLAYQLQARVYGDLSKETKRLLETLASQDASGDKAKEPVPLPGQGS